MFQKVLSFLTLILVAVVVWQAREEVLQAVTYLSQTNLWFILALIPEQLFMYYCLGMMFFSYMSAKQSSKKISHWTLSRISFELNFVNHAIPSGGVAGLGYMSWRLHKFGSSVGQTSFMYALRYAITIAVNQLQTLIAIAILLCTSGIANEAWWVVWLTLLTCFGILGVIAIAIAIASSRKRIDWFVKIASNFINKLVKLLTFGKKRQVLQYNSVEKVFVDLHKDVLIARRNKKLLKKPILWGIAYGFLEFATFWLVAISMGHPEILPQIMVGVAIASVIGAVLLTPGGVGGYEGAMILVMSVLGVHVGLATAVVVTTRVIILVSTIVSGYGFYQNAIHKLGKPTKLKTT